VTATEQAAPTGVPQRALRHIPEFLLGVGALVLRAALGAAGAVAQGMTRNPPASAPVRPALGEATGMGLPSK
jgi:ABC-type enterobactin transport system permease subunit